MKEDVIKTVATAMGFTPLEIVLMVAVVAMFFILLKTTIETTKSLTNNTNALNNLTSMIKMRKGKI